MAHYRKGLRVRIVHAPNAPLLVGRETVIVGEERVDIGFMAFEAWVLDIPTTPGYARPFYCCPKESAGECLVPILDENQPCESDFKESLEKLGEKHSFTDDVNRWIHVNLGSDK